MKLLTYLLRFLLALVLIVAVLLNWPKGSWEQQLKNNHVPALAYGIIENGQLTEVKVMGELITGQAAPENAIFNVASVTKPVFALSVLKLIAAGNLELDEPLHPYWVDPDLIADPRHKSLTPRILLSHQSGFPNWRWLTQDGKLAFQFDPGTGYQYAGEGYEYLRLAIQEKLGLSWEQLADSLIFQPLGMPDSRLIWDSLMPEERFARWHNSEGELYETNKREQAVASDDLMTTVRDYANFLEHVIQGANLPNELFQEMTTEQVQVNKRMGFGLGWEVVPDLPSGEYALVHGGSDMGVRARAVVLPESGRGFIAFANGDNAQKLIDRVMVKEFGPGKALISRMYAPFIWRIIHLPFNLF
ncbi:MAG: serine hydrolase domain-containing protein [Bacteroidota bacterium]